MAGLLPAVANARKMNQKWSTKLEFTMVPHWCAVRHMCWKVLNHTETGEQVLLELLCCKRRCVGYLLIFAYIILHHQNEVVAGRSSFSLDSIGWHDG